MSREEPQTNFVNRLVNRDCGAAVDFANRRRRRRPTTVVSGRVSTILVNTHKAMDVTGRRSGRAHAPAIRFRGNRNVHTFGVGDHDATEQNLVMATDSTARIKMAAAS